VWALEGWAGNFEDAVKWKVGDGREISFWEDSWLNCDALKRGFPRLFSLSLVKDAKVTQLVVWSNGVWVWFLDWKRSFFEWEKPSECRLLRNLHRAGLVLGEKDRWLWEVGEFQKYSVSSAYTLLRRDREEDLSSVYSRLWRCKTLPFALLTTWRVLENRIVTTINLERQGIVVDNLLCCLCGKDDESHCHLFFDCRFDWLVWCLCFEWLGVTFVIHSDPVSNFIQFGMCNASGQVNEFWRVIWVGVVSEIWKHRNNVIFNWRKVDVSEVFVMVQVKVWSLIYSKSRFMMFSYSNWCLDPVVCMRLTIWCFVMWDCLMIVLGLCLFGRFLLGGRRIWDVFCLFFL